MFPPPGSRMSPEAFALRLDAAKARAAALREEAIREFGASVVAAIAAAGRRLASAVRATRTPAPGGDRAIMPSPPA